MAQIDQQFNQVIKNIPYNLAFLYQPSYERNKLVKIKIKFTLTYVYYIILYPLLSSLF